MQSRESKVQACWSGSENAEHGRVTPGVAQGAHFFDGAVPTLGGPVVTYLPYSTAPHVVARTSCCLSRGSSRQQMTRTLGLSRHTCKSAKADAIPIESEKRAEGRERPAGGEMSAWKRGSG